MRAMFFMVLIAVFFARPANAGAIYNWVPAAGANQTISGALTISDEAYFAGGVNWSDEEALSGGTGPTPVEQYFLQGTFSGFTDGDNPVPYSLTLGSYFAGNEAYSWELSPWDWFFDLIVVGDGLSGGIYLNNTSTEIGLSASDPALWQLTTVGTDQLPSGLPCSTWRDNAACADALGRWQLVSAPVRPVPEPGALYLMVLGLAALRRAANARRPLGTAWQSPAPFPSPPEAAAGRSHQRRHRPPSQDG